MSRRPRICPPDLPVHIIQRGNNRQICFSSDADIAAYAHWLAEGAEKYHVDIHGWVFMTNHIHLLLTPRQEGSISMLMQFLGRLYVRYFNHRYARTGTLFEGRFRSSVIESERYLLTCLGYIELNPVRAGLVTDPGDYRWSSFGAHALNVEPAMWKPHTLYLSLGGNKRARRRQYRQVIKERLDIDTIARIRHCANRGLVLGSEKFREQFEQLTGGPAPPS